MLESVSNDAVNLLAKAREHQSWRKRTACKTKKILMEISTVQEKLTPRCAHIVLTCLYTARIGGPDLLWTGDYTGKVGHTLEYSL